MALAMRFIDQVDCVSISTKIKFFSEKLHKLYSDFQAGSTVFDESRKIKMQEEMKLLRFRLESLEQQKTNRPKKAYKM